MSDIRANTISNAAGTGPIDLHKQSAAKAWGRANSSSLSVDASFNFSSITDVAVGKASFALTSSMSGATTYAFSGSTLNSAANRYVIGDSATSSASVIGVMRGNPASGSFIDGPMHFAVNGELA